MNRAPTPLTVSVLAFGVSLTLPEHKVSLGSPNRTDDA